MVRSIQNIHMSLIQLIDEMIDPHDVWMKEYTRRAGGALSNCRRKLVGNPQLDLYPVEGGTELKADLPGIAKADLKITVEGDMLVLTGERKNVLERDEGTFHYAERRFGKFSRRLRLPYHADPSTVTARFEAGVLIVMIPQPESTRAGEIMIE